MKRIHIAILVFISVLAGATATFLTQTYFQTKMSRDWRQLSLEPPHHGFFDQFIPEELSGKPLPNIKEIAGKAKFIDLPNNGVEQKHLACLITVTVENLDSSKLPEKYREKEKRGEEIVHPIKEKYYQVHFVFQLKDKDGFVLLFLTRYPEYLELGRKNQFQWIVEEPIPPDIAKRTNAITFNMYVDKCMDCE